MSKTPTEYWPVAYNFGACSDLREFVQQAQADILCKDPPSPPEPPPPPEPIKIVGEIVGQFDAFEAYHWLTRLAPSNESVNGVREKIQAALAALPKPNGICPKCGSNWCSDAGCGTP